MRPLYIGPAEKALIRQVVEYAKARSHWYLVGPDLSTTQSPPGDVVEHVCWLPIDYRCVFSYTLDATGLYRHLSVSVPYGWASPLRIGMIATAFGFTGWCPEWPDDWHTDLQDNPRCVVVMQLISE